MIRLPHKMQGEDGTPFDTVGSTIRGQEGTRLPPWSLTGSGLPGEVVCGDGGGEVVLVDPGGGTAQRARGRVVAAEQGEVEQGCCAAVRPVPDVVSFSVGT